MQISFKGRCGRVEFLLQVIFNFVALFGIGAVVTKAPLILAACPLILLLFFSVTFQRLHDIGQSGMWAVIWFVPGLHLVFLFYLLLRKGDEGPNQYGVAPNAEVLPSEGPQDLKEIFAEMDADVEREEHEHKLWAIIEKLVDNGISENDFPSELSRYYEMLDCRKGSLFLEKKGEFWRIIVSSSDYPHIETDFEFSVN